MSDTAAEPNCTTCGGAKNEHFDEEGKLKTIHPYTKDSPELSTPAQREKSHQNQQPTVIRLPGAQTNEAGAIGRLVEILIESKVLTPAQALYVANMGPKPDKSSGYQDPATVVKVKN